MKNFSSLLVLLLISVLVISCNLSRFTEGAKENAPVDEPAIEKEEDIKIADEEIVFDDSDKFPITKVEYNKISNGMTYNDVVKVLRRKGEMLNSSMVGEHKIETYRWKGDAKYSFIKCTFRNGVLTTKDESNLK